MKWARISNYPVTSERRVGVVNYAGKKGIAPVNWVDGCAMLGKVHAEDGRLLDIAPTHVASVEAL